MAGHGVVMGCFIIAPGHDQRVWIRPGGACGDLGQGRSLRLASGDQAWRRAGHGRFASGPTIQGAWHRVGLVTRLRREDALLWVERERDSGESKLILLEPERLARDALSC